MELSGLLAEPREDGVDFDMRGIVTIARAAASSTFGGSTAGALVVNEGTEDSFALIPVDTPPGGLWEVKSERCESVLVSVFFIDTEGMSEVDLGDSTFDEDLACQDECDVCAFVDALALSVESLDDKFSVTIDGTGVIFAEFVFVDVESAVGCAASADGAITSELSFV